MPGRSALDDAVHPEHDSGDDRGGNASAFAAIMAVVETIGAWSGRAAVKRAANQPSGCCHENQGTGEE
jgi:hypothetical protein